VTRIIAGEVDALAVTCQVQFRHLLEVARRRSLDRQLLLALRQRVAIAAVGPVCHALLQAHGVPVHVMPDHPSVGALVRSLMLHLERTNQGRSLPSGHDASALSRPTVGAD
jgi:uroporphyrinogen-III synthase